MNIVTYANKKYEPYVLTLYESLKLTRPNFLKEDTFIYYGVGFHPQLKEKNVVNLTFPSPENPNRLEFIKPKILLDVLHKFENETFCFIDADIIVGKRLDFNKLLQGKNFIYPLGGHQYCEIPYLYDQYPNGDITYYTTNALCEYLGVDVKVTIEGTPTVKGNSCRYIQNCFILFNNSHYDFILEWDSICSNKFLRKNKQQQTYYLPYPDETVFNTLLWKYKVTETLGFIHTNCHTFEAYKKGEENNFLQNELLIPNHPPSLVFDAQNLMYYHGYKNTEETHKIINYLHENMPS